MQRLKTLIVKREHLEADIAALSDEVAALERELQRYLWKVPATDRSASTI
jgi:DNA-binding ferritin-like protein (Dps family)